MRAIVSRENGRWVAQCLEYDLCTSARDRRELTRKLAPRLRLQMTINFLKGNKPFQDLPRAPQKFWEMYSGSTPQEMLRIRGPWLRNLFRAWRGLSQVQANLALAAAQGCGDP